MTKAVIIKIDKYRFLLKDSAQDDSIEYLIANKNNLLAIARAGEEVKKDMISSNLDKSISEKIREIKEKIDIAGYPFDMRDPILYALDQGIEVEMEIDL